MNKTCIVCGQSKDVSMFYKNPHVKDGFEGRCKECRKAYQTEWRANNRQKHREYSRAYFADHKTERRIYFLAWVDRNKEHKAEYDRLYKYKDIERTNTQRKIDNSRRRARLINSSGKFTRKEWVELKSRYGNKCLKCGKSEAEVKITPDHVIPLALGGSNSIDNIQPLCWGCNAAKQARIADYRND